VLHVGHAREVAYGSCLEDFPGEVEGCFSMVAWEWESRFSGWGQREDADACGPVRFLDEEFCFSVEEAVDLFAKVGSEMVGHAGCDGGWRGVVGGWRWGGVTWAPEHLDSFILKPAMCSQSKTQASNTIASFIHPRGGKGGCL